MYRTHKGQMVPWNLEVHLSFPVFSWRGPSALTTPLPLYLINASAERFILPDAARTVGTHVDAVLYLFVRGVTVKG